MRIVTLGGGTGQAQLLKGLAARGADVTAIVGVTDNGGHSGHLRKQFSIPAVGDLRGCIAALTAERNGLGRTLRHRFESGESLGNLILAGLTLLEGSVTAAAKKLTRVAGFPGRVLPISNDSGHIAARLENGRTVKGEWEIIQRKPRSRIERLFHAPRIEATPEAIKALKRAGLVVVGPGSLRTALVSVLLAKGVRDALKSRRVAYVLNILTQPGQTDGFSARDHVDEIARYLGRPPDLVIANSTKPPAWAIGEAEWVDPTGYAAVDLLEKVDRRDIRRRARPPQFVAGPHLVRHDPGKLARAVLIVGTASAPPSLRGPSSLPRG